MSSRKVLLVSRLSTQNAGNEALSKILIDYFSASAPTAELFTLDRYPRYFEQFGITGPRSGLVERFDALASKLIGKFSSPYASMPPRAARSAVKLDRSAQELKGLLRSAKRQLGVRRRLAAIRLVERADPIIAISACTDCDLLVWNAAGEIHPTGSVNEVFRLLLLIRIAQLSGKLTAVVNHSLEVHDERLRDLLAHVYSDLDYIGVRDALSVGVAEQLGAFRDRIVEAPDLVFLATRAPSEAPHGQTRNDPIGLAINGLAALAGRNEWPQLMAGLKDSGRRLIFVSNAVNHDLDFAKILAKSVPGSEVIMHQPGYEDLGGYFRQCSVVISSRLHSSILALCEGIPVVTIEPSVFKLTAIMDGLGYPIPTENLMSQGWAGRALANVQRCLSDEGLQLGLVGTEMVNAQADRIEQAYRPLFDLLA